MPADLERIYDADFDIGQIPEAQREEFRNHSVVLVEPPRQFVLGSTLTLGLSATMFVAIAHSMLPRIKRDDFHGIGGRYKAMLLLFPLVNYYGRGRVYLRLVDRINFQYRLRGMPPPIDRELVEKWVRRNRFLVGLIRLSGRKRRRILKQMAKALNRLAVTEGVPALAEKQASSFLEPGEQVKLAVSGGPHNRLAGLITLPFQLLPEPLGSLVEAGAEMIVGLRFRHRHVLLTDRHIYVMRAKYYFFNFRTDSLLAKLELGSAHAEIVGSALLGRGLRVDGWKVYPGWGKIGTDVARAMAAAAEGERSPEAPPLSLPSLQ